jgi:hypothetical protein
MASLYADEDFDYPAVEELRQLGHDVLTVQEAGQRGQGDRAVLAPSHCGIIVCTRDQNSAALAGRIHQAIASQPNLDNQLIRIYRPPVP